MRRTVTSLKNREAAIKAGIFGVFGCLIVFLLLELGHKTAESYGNFAMAASSRRFDDGASRLVKGIYDLLLEWLATSNALEAEGPAPPETIARILGTRKSIAENFEAGLGILSQVDYANKTALLSKLNHFMNEAEIYRLNADVALRLPRERRDREFCRKYPAMISGFVDAALDVWYSALNASATGSVRLSRLAQVKEIGWRLREYASRERALISGAIASGSPVNAEQGKSWRRRVEAVFARLVHLNAVDPNPHIDKAIGSARSLYFERFRALADEIYAASAAGKPYPISAEKWIEITDPQIDSLLSVMSAANVASAEVANEIEKQAYRSALQAIYLFALGIGLGLACVGLLSLWQRLQAETGKARRLAELRASELSSTLEHMGQGLTMYDASGKLLIWNKKYLELFGFAPDEVSAGLPVEQMHKKVQAKTVPPDKPAAVIDALVNASDGSEGVLRRTKGGRLILSKAWPMPAGGYVVTHEDITGREAANAKIHYQATHDSLTRILNRSALKMELASALSTKAPLGESFTLMLLDLDRFKSVNDTFGHAFGDKLLKEVASRLMTSVRDRGKVARLGGDEFAVIHFLPAGEHSDKGAHVNRLAERLIETVSAPYLIENRQVAIGASVGVAVALRDGATIAELLSNADAALYRAKAAGRNAYRVFDAQISAAARHRRALERDLRTALELDQFRLLYQPIVDLKSGHVRGAEALLRWHHPDLGVISPGTFIPLLEESGLIAKVGDWIIARACRDCLALPEQVRVSVNISPVQILNRNLCATFRKALADSRLGPERLEIEVTENVLLANDQDLLTELHRLRDLGITVALDDFGTGYSTFGYLRMFPFDKIKIDKSFVDQFGKRPDSNAIVCSIIALAANLNIVSTAEGVETAEQAELLAISGCVEGQGYWFGRPQLIKELCAKLAEGKSVEALASRLG